MSATQAFSSKDDLHWLNTNVLQGFFKYLDSFRFLDSLLQEKKKRFYELLAASFYHRDADGAALERDKLFDYSEFYLRRSYFNENKTRVKDDNLLAYLQDYLKKLRKEIDVKSLPPERRRMLNDLQAMAQLTDRAAPGRRAPEDQGNYFSYIAPRDNQMVSGAVVRTAYQYKPSYLFSSITSFAASAGTSALINTTSRVAIAAALGTVGVPAFVVPVAAGIAAGVLCGAFNSYRKNHSYIRSLVDQETTMRGRMSARWRGFKNSYSGKQFLLNTVTSTLGVGVGMGVSEYILNNGYLDPLKQHFSAMVQPHVQTLNTAFGYASQHLQPVITASTDLLKEYDLLPISENPQPEVTASLATDTVAEPIKAGAEAALDIPEPRVVKTVPIPVETAVVPDSTLNERMMADENFASLAGDPNVDAAFDDLRERITANGGVQAYLEERLNTGQGALETVQGAAETDNPLVTPDIPEKDPVVAAVDPAPETVIAAPISHKVVHGDNLWKLAEQLGGVSAHDAAGHHEFIRKTVALNPSLLSNPNALILGQDLIIPDQNTDVEAQCRVVRGRVRSCSL